MTPHHYQISTQQHRWTLLPLVVFSFGLCVSQAGAFLMHHQKAASYIIYTSSTFTQSSVLLFAQKLSVADKDRLLTAEVGMTAFIVAEMRHFVNETVVEFDRGLRFEQKWKMPLEDKLQMGLATVMDATEELNGGGKEDDEAKTGANDNIVFDQAYSKASSSMTSLEAVEIVCNITRTAFLDGFQQSGLLSALGSAIIYFQGFYRTPEGIAACEHIGLSDYAIAHHITDMYHHRTFRGTYTKTLPASGKGEIAAAVAVGLMSESEALAKYEQIDGMAGDDGSSGEEEVVHDEADECLLWSPTTPNSCLHWKSDDDAWRKTRFERIQMEGTKDPRRGGSGTSR